MDKFFIRFCLQRSKGTFKEDIPYECIMDTTKEEADAFVLECNEWQRKQADMLCSFVDVSKIKGKKVLFLGDSLTADRLSYRGIVTKAAQFTEYNEAISSCVSTDMLLQIKGCVEAYNPDIISIMLGTNDSLIIDDEINLVSKKEYQKNLDTIIKIGKLSGAEIIISTIPPVDEERFCIAHKSNNSINISAYCDIIRKEAVKYDIILNDFNKTAKQKSFFEIIENDGVHLTPYGQRLLAEGWLKCFL